MLVPLLLFAQLQTAANIATPAIHSGRDDRTAIRPPRAEMSVAIDGVLDEPVWAQAVVLSGFSQFAPVDGVPANDSTHVFVWYSPTAIHFGVLAFEAHGGVHATLADRDRIQRVVDLADALLVEAETLARDKAFTEEASRLKPLDILGGISFYDEVQRFETHLIKMALAETGGNQAKAARLLGIKATTLNSKIKLFKIDVG